MKPEDIADAFAPRDAGQRSDISARNRARVLESRDFKLASLISGIYAYTAFNIFLVAGTLLFAPGQAQAFALFMLCLGLLFALMIWRVWRKRAANSWLLASPALLTLMLCIVVGTWLTVGFALNLVACGAIYALMRVREDKSAVQPG